MNFVCVVEAVALHSKSIIWKNLQLPSLKKTRKIDSVALFQIPLIKKSNKKTQKTWTDKQNHKCIQESQQRIRWPSYLVT